MKAKLLKDCIDVQLVVSDIEGSLTFWRDLLGFQIEEKVNPVPGVFQYRLRAGDSLVKLVTGDKAQASALLNKSGYRGLTIQFVNFHEIVDNLRSKGYKFLFDARPSFVHPNSGKLICLLADPEGNILELESPPNPDWRPDYYSEAGGEKRQGPAAQLAKDSFDVHLVVSDIEKSLGFWCDALGLEVEDKYSPSPDITLYRVLAGDSVIKIVTRSEKAAVGILKETGFRALTLTIDNVDEMIEACRSQGYNIVMDVRPSFVYGSTGKRVSQVQDPEGNVVQLETMLASD